MHCVSAITKALTALDGVGKVDADLQGKTVAVEHSEAVAYATLKNEIEDLGYDVEEGR